MPLDGSDDNAVADWWLDTPTPIAGFPLGAPGRRVPYARAELEAYRGEMRANWLRARRPPHAVTYRGERSARHPD